MENKVNATYNDNLILLMETIDNEINKRSILHHQFYTLWNEGKLSLNHLRGYSKEYFQLVKIVPELVLSIYKNFEKHTSNNYYLKSIKKTYLEELDHIEAWLKFSLSLGLEKNELLNYNGTNEVNLAIENLKSLCSSTLIEGVSTMYSFEKELPQISKRKIEGLKQYYGIDKQEDIKYFKIHEIADIEHAKLWKSLIMDSKINDFKENYSNEPAIKASINSLIVQNQILDSVYNTYVKNTIS
jgi:pyrroloquinoline-quinone synthase